MTQNKINRNIMDPLSAGIGAAGSLFGGILTNSYNRWMMRQQMKYNTAEREASQEWQNQQRVAQNQFSEDMYNKYSSPQALVEQYKAAGLNPRLAVEGGQVGSVQASSGSSGSAPNGAMASMPYMQSPDFTQGFVNMANVVKSLADAARSGADTKRTMALLDGEIQDQMLRVKTQEFFLGQNIKYDDQERLLKLAKIQTDINASEQQILNAKKDYDILCQKLRISTFEADNWWSAWQLKKESQEVVNDNVRADTGVKIEQAELLKVDQALHKAMTYTEYKKPAYYEAITKVENAVAKFKEFDNYTRDMFKDEVRQDFLATHQEHIRSVKAAADLLWEQLEDAQNNNNVFDFKMMLEVWRTFIPILNASMMAL